MKVLELLQKHVLVAMTEMVEDKETHSRLEGSMFQSLLKIKEDKKFTRGETILRGNAKYIIDKLAIYAKNLVQK